MLFLFDEYMFYRVFVLQYQNFDLDMDINMVKMSAPRIEHLIVTKRTHVMEMAIHG